MLHGETTDYVTGTLTEATKILGKYLSENDQYRSYIWINPFRFSMFQPHLAHFQLTRYTEFIDSNSGVKEDFQCS